MDNLSSKQRFRPRKHVKTQLSQRENTARTRKWERSLVGLDSALLKISRNQRVAISRERKRMQDAPDWSTLNSSEKSHREAAMVARITAKYQKEKQELISRERRQNEEKESEEQDDSEEAETEFETDDVGEGKGPENNENEVGEENEVHTSETDETDSEFESDVDEGVCNNEELSDEKKTILQSSIADIYQKAFRDIEKAVNQFEKWGSYDEDPVED